MKECVWLSVSLCWPCDGLTCPGFTQSAVSVSDRIKRVKLTDEWTDDVSNEKSYVYSYYLTNNMSTLITAEEVTDVEMKLFQVTIVP